MSDIRVKSEDDPLDPHPPIQCNRRWMLSGRRGSVVGARRARPILLQYSVGPLPNLLNYRRATMGTCSCHCDG